MDESYLSGGPVDGIFAALAENFPGVSIQRLQVSDPGTDDDNLWFIRLRPDATVEAQVETRDRDRRLPRPHLRGCAYACAGIRCRPSRTP
jgi:hypothetical protein